MKVICFSGNLSNQVFYCAFKDYLKRKNPKTKFYRYIKTLKFVVDNYEQILLEVNEK